MITKQTNNKTESDYSGGRYCGADAGHTHLESFPTSAQRESGRPDRHYPVLLAIHFLGELPVQMVLSCSFMVALKLQK